MDRNITKKRKLKEAEAISNGIDSAKKSKKQPKAVPKPAEENEDLEDEDVDEEEEEEQEEQDEEEENDDEAPEDNEEDDEEEEDENENGTDLPAGLVPTLPPTAGDAASFDELKLSDKTMKSIGEMGFTKMTSIQRAVRYTPISKLQLPAVCIHILTTFYLGHSPTARRQGRSRCSQDWFR